eukprot:286667_1
MAVAMARAFAISSVFLSLSPCFLCSPATDQNAALPLLPAIPPPRLYLELSGLFRNVHCLEVTVLTGGESGFVLEFPLGRRRTRGDMADDHRIAHSVSNPDNTRLVGPVSLEINLLQNCLTGTDQDTVKVVNEGITVELNHARVAIGLHSVEWDDFEPTVYSKKSVRFKTKSPSIDKSAKKSVWKTIDKSKDSTGDADQTVMSPGMFASIRTTLLLLLVAILAVMVPLCFLIYWCRTRARVPGKAPTGNRGPEYRQVDEASGDVSDSVSEILLRIRNDE